MFDKQTKKLKQEQMLNEKCQIKGTRGMLKELNAKFQKAESEMLNRGNEFHLVREREYARKKRGHLKECMREMREARVSHDHNVEELRAKTMLYFLKQILKVYSHLLSIC